MDPNAKQLAVERLKNSANVLVTVGVNPTVDALSALIGFSLLLGKLGKHASAVFSGQVPPAMEFLEPGKRLEKDVASLRDFIIALDKDKADKLRYKVEENVVKIFITPYKTRITQDDLSFSEGDFNVDTVVALGVSKRDDLDNAIKAHGRILHDASVITVNAGGNSSDLGAIDWQDPSASSLCEMLVSISESFGSGLLDEQISTAFLTGIVAATERFSNTKTSPKIMTMAAQLMAAGANQQLISNNLQTGQPPPPPPPVADDSQLSIDHGDKPAAAPPPPPPPEIDLPKPQNQPSPPPPAPAEEPHDKTLKDLEDEISKLAKSGKPKSKPSKPTEPKAQDKPPQAKNLISHPKGHGPREVEDENPLMGGTFNATAQQAHEESVSEMKKSVNSTLLNHPGPPLDDKAEAPDERPISRAPTVRPLTLDQPPVPTPPPMPPQLMSPEPPAPPEIIKDAAQPGAIDVEAARKEVEEAVNSQAFNPSLNPLESIGSQPLPGEADVVSPEIAIDQSGNIQPGQTAVPPPGDPNQEFKLPS